MAKQKQKKDFPIFTVFCLIIGILLAVIIASTVLSNIGFKARRTEVMKVGDMSVNALEFSYAFQSTYSQHYPYLSYFGVDTSKPGWMDQTSTMAQGKTWKQYFADSAGEELKTVLALYQKAKSDKDFKLDQASVDKRIDERVNNDKADANKNKVDIDTYYSYVYGKGFKEKDLRKMMEIALVAGDYSKNYSENILKYTDEDLEKYYLENKANYDLYTYVQVDFAYEEKKDDTDKKDTDDNKDEKKPSAEEQAAIDSANALVEKFKKDKMTAEQLLKEGGKTAKSLTKVEYADIAGTTVKEWLSDKDRKPGDIGVVKSDTLTHSVVLLVATERDNYKLADVRLLPVEPVAKDPNKGPSAEEIKEAEKTAKDILAKFEKTKKTEDDFKKLIKENCKDSSIVEKEGFIDDMNKTTAKSGFGAEAKDWIFSADRKKGDYKLIQNVDSWVLVYYISAGDVFWSESVEANLRNTDTENWTKKIIESFNNSTSFDSEKALKALSI